MNWIEFKSRREKHLAEAEHGIWQEVVVAVENCCASYQRLYAHVGELTCSRANGSSINLRIVFSGGATPASSGSAKNTARITFMRDPISGVPALSLIVGAARTVPFPIDANEEKCFITRGGKQLTPDDFCKVALEEFLFEEPTLAQQRGPKPPPSQWG